jgi:hypothetical protein
MQEQWIRWNPIGGLAKKYYLDSILYKERELIILLAEEKNERNKVQVIFNNSIKSYKHTEETSTLKTISDIDEKYGGDFYAYWTFFKIQNSDYLKWILEQSLETSYDKLALFHFSFITPISILDVISKSDPLVELIKK